MYLSYACRHVPPEHSAFSDKWFWCSEHWLSATIIVYIAIFIYCYLVVWAKLSERISLEGSAYLSAVSRMAALRFTARQHCYVYSRELHGMDICPHPQPSPRTVVPIPSVPANHHPHPRPSPVTFMLFPRIHGAGRLLKVLSTMENWPQFRGNTVTANSIPAVLPLFLVPSPRYYRHVRPHYRGKRADTAVFPQSPLPCSPLVYSSYSIARYSVFTGVRDNAHCQALLPCQCVVTNIAGWIPVRADCLSVIDNFNHVASQPTSVGVHNSAVCIRQHIWTHIFTARQHSLLCRALY